MFATRIRVWGPGRSLFSFYMVLLMLAVAMSVFPGAAATAYSAVTVYWNATTTNDDGTPLTDLSGFKIYYGLSTWSYSNSLDVGNVTTYTLTNLQPGIYYFVTTAYNIWALRALIRMKL